jgi:hypothetical protein
MGAVVSGEFDDFLCRLWGFVLGSGKGKGRDMLAVLRGSLHQIRERASTLEGEFLGIWGAVVLV